MNNLELKNLVAIVRVQKVLSPSEESLLNCLAERFPSGITEDVLADELHRTSHVSKEQSDIRTSVSRVRQGLKGFFKYELAGKKSASRLQIPYRPPYRLEIVKNEPALDPVETFWDAHFSNASQNLIIYTEPLFFWDKEHRCYIRYLNLNDESSSLDVDRIRRNLPADHPATRLQPCFHYQSSGETQAQRILRKWFEQQDDVDVKLSRECVDSEVWKHNIVVLGNSRTNRFLRILQKELTFLLQDDKVAVKARGRKRSYELVDLEPSPKEPSERYLYAVLTRRPSTVKQRCVTMIAANHGRGIEKVAETLTLPNAIDRLYSQLQLDRTQPLPDRFQLLFRIQTLDHELAPGEPELIDSIIDTRPRTAASGG